jgi:RimJ/RimL family protein N-acetyltransferase
MSFEPLRLRARLMGAQSERLVLREPQLGDAIDLFEATRHPLFNQHLMWQAPANLDAVRQRLQKVMDRADAGICTALAAADRASGRWAALFRFEPREHAGWAELGLWSHPAFWGAGHGEELTRLAIDEAFAKSDLAAVVACAKEEHKASQRVLERCGLEPIGVELRAHESGHDVPLMQMQLTRQRWQWLRDLPITVCAHAGMTEAAPLH